jgi:hypothetical protein
MDFLIKRPSLDYSFNLDAFWIYLTLTVALAPRASPKHLGNLGEH